MVKHTGKLRNMASIYLLCEGKVLLLHRQGDSIVSNLWIGSAGGHFEESELNSANACALRELREELSIDPGALQNLQLRYVTLRYTDGEIRQNYYFFASICTDTQIAPVSTEGICQWFPLTETSGLPMPVTARSVLEHYVSQGQFTEHLYSGIATNQGVHFTAL